MSSWGVGLGDYPIEKKDDKDKKDKKEKKGKPKKDKEAEDKDAASKRRRANTAGGVAAPGALALEGAAAADDENTARLSNFKLGKAHTGLLRTLVKQTLSNTQHVRELQSFTNDTYKLSSEDDIVTHTKSAARAYGAAVREAGKGHQLGAPVLHIYRGLIAALLKRKSDIAPSTYQYLDAVNTTNLTASQMYMVIRQCKMIPCYDHDWFRLVLSIRDAPLYEMTSAEAPTRQTLAESSLRNVMHSALLSCGAVHLQGKAPPGGMENILSKTLD